MEADNQVEEQLKQIYKIVDEIPQTPQVKGYDFNQELNYEKLFQSYQTTGFQASLFHQAIEELNKMIRWRLSDDPINPDRDSDECLDPEFRKTVKCTIFLGYTSNMISCGMREILRYLAEHKMIDCIVTSAGGIEEDFIKCLAPFYMAKNNKWEQDDKQLRLSALNRIGNILVPNKSYVLLEEWLTPIFQELNDDQEKNGTIYTPQMIINKLGQKINNPESVYFWCWKNDIPVFCPAFTDGAFGDMLYYFSIKHDKFIVDMVKDIRKLNNMTLKAKKSGVLIIGGGMVKHHILNANIWRNGADFGVFINTGLHQDGSDGGAMISEALTWGKMKIDSTFVKVWAEATLIFPILVAETFKKHQQNACRVENCQCKNKQVNQ